MSLLSPAIDGLADECLINALLHHDREPSVNTSSVDDYDHSRMGKVYKASKIQDVVECLVNLSGQATIYDAYQRSDHLTEF